MTKRQAEDRPSSDVCQDAGLDAIAKDLATLRKGIRALARAKRVRRSAALAAVQGLGVLSDEIKRRTTEDSPRLGLGE